MLEGVANILYSPLPRLLLDNPYDSVAFFGLFLMFLVVF